MSFIKVKCENCGTDHQVNGDQFQYEQVDSDERQMGAELTFEGSVEVECKCGSTIEVTHRYWEYPVGVENHKESEVAGAEIVENHL